MLKHLETHITDIILLPQDHSLKWWTPSPNFVFTKDNFPYLLGSETPPKCQHIDDGTVSLGSPILLPTFARNFDLDYFASVPIFIDHESTADYIEQSFIWWCNVTSLFYFGSIKNIFTCSVPVGLYSLVASTCPMGVQYNFIDKCSCSRCKWSEPPQQPQWLLDSGASMHFTGQRSDLVDAFKLAQPLIIQMANNITQVEEARTVFITHTVHLQNSKVYEKTTCLQPIYYLNGLNTHLLSMGEFLNDKQLITGNNCQLIFLRNKLPVLTYQPHVVGSTTFWLNSTIESVQSLSAKTRTVYAADYSIWHQQMGHLDDDIFWKLPDIVKEAPKLITIPTAKKPCEACAKEKMPSCSFLPSVSWAMKPFQIVHSDLKDMIKRSFNGYHYVLTILDDFMSHAYSFNLKKKSDTIIHAWQFVAYAKNQHNASIGTWQFDGRTEFLNDTFETILRDNGILSETSVPYQHQQNSRAEHLNHTIMDKAQSMHFHACLTDTMWEFLWDHMIHVYNRTPICHLKWQTPFEALRNDKPDVSSPCIWMWCLCFPTGRY